LSEPEVGILKVLGKSSELAQPSELTQEGFECDPIVSVQANNKLRFDILKNLADEYNFEITILESENKLMSLEKKQPLSKVVESVTRDMSVFLIFQNLNGCKRLVEISVLDNSEWSSGSGYNSSKNRSDLAEKLQKYKPKFKPISVLNEEDLEQLEDVPQAIKQKQEELRQRRLEKKKMRTLNDELINGDELKTRFNVRGDSWKKDIKGRREIIPDMEVYVQEVLDGERKPDMRNMTVKQRSEYMEVRRKLRAGQE